MIAVERLRTGDVTVSRDHKRRDCAWKHRALVGPRSLLTHLRDLQSAFDCALSSDMFAKCPQDDTGEVFKETVWTCAGTFLSLVFRFILRTAKSDR